MLDTAFSDVDLLDTVQPLGRAGDEPIAGYRLLEPLGKGGFGEVWRCQVPGGLFKAIKLVRGNADLANRDADLARQELQSLEFIKNIRHPFVLSVERVELVGNMLLIVMELADQSLDDLGKTYRDKGQPGIPRAELLEYLAEAAEALDVINFQHGLQHLDVKPQNLFLVSRHIKVADFGLVTRLARRGAAAGQGAQCPGVTPRYASPESLQGQLTRQSDQYSLAIVYQELLTGEMPFKGRNTSQLLLQHLHSQPDLNALPVHDRPLVARALAKNPEQRFRSCADFVRTLLLADADPSRSIRGGSSILRRVKLSDTPPSEEDDASRADASATTETALAQSALTQTVAANTLQGLAYQRPLGQTPLGELWLVTTPTGEEKIAYHLSGFTVEDPGEQTKALQYLQSLTHPALCRFEIGELGPNRIVLLSDAWPPSLLDRRKAKEFAAGELVGYLIEAAQALDALATTANLFHLGLTPGGIHLDLDGVQIRDFGLIALLWQPGSKSLTSCNPRCAAPELAANRPSATSDQYSLAMIYLQMTQTGQGSGGNKHGAQGRAAAGPLAQLSRFPSRERVILEKALDKNPKNRYPTNVQFVQALADSMQQRGVSSTTTRTAFIAAQAGFLEQLRAWIERKAKEESAAAAPSTYRAASDGSMTSVFGALVVPGTARLRLEIFRQEWNAVVTKEEKDQFQLFIPVERSFWQRLRRTIVGIEITVGVEATTRKNGLARLRAKLRPVDCPPEFLRQLHEKTGPALFASLHKSFGAAPDRRHNGRIPFTKSVTVRHRASGHRPVELTCRAKDISATGICFLTPTAMVSGEVRVQFDVSDNKEPALVVLRANIARCEQQPSGSYEIGAHFVQEKASK